MLGRELTLKKCWFNYLLAFSASFFIFSWILLLFLFNCSVLSYSLQPHGLQHARLPCPSQSPRVCSDSSPLSQWCHPTISLSLIPFSSCLQSFPASESFPVSQLFTSGGQIIGASASVLLMNIQGWFPLGLADLISLQSEELSRVFSNTTVWKHQFLGAQLPGGSDGKASAYNVGDPGSIPRLGRSPGEGNGNPLQYSCLENPMDGEAW